jgi:uncharacterized protein YjbJ (UPF0337 family)
MGDMKHKAEEALGEAKSKLGEHTDDKNLQAEGEKDKSEADFKQGVDKMKDAFKKD